MNLKEVRYLFSSSELTEKHDRMFMIARLVLLAGVVAWLLATMEQMRIFPEQRSDLLRGAVPAILWFCAYTSGFFILVRSYPRRRRILFQSIFVLDIAFITSLILATGACQSNFYLAYYLFIALGVFFFGMLGGAALTCGAGLVYFCLYIANSDQLFAGDFALRVGFMFLTYFVLAALAENEKIARMNLEMRKNQIEGLNRLLEEKNRRLLEENDFKEQAVREKTEILNREHDAAQRRRFHIDFARELNDKGTAEEACEVFIRYVESLIGADHVAVVTLDANKRTANLFAKPDAGEAERKEIPFNHPLVTAFYKEGSESDESDLFRKTWIDGDGEPAPDAFLIVPGGRPGTLHIEGISGGRAGASIMVVAARKIRRRYNSDLLDETRLIGNHLAVAVKNLSLRQRLQEMADTDGLTGLYNHRYFQDVLSREVRRALRYKRPVSVVLFDIDHFKKFNDTYGHPAGDAVLREIAAIAGESLRNVDILARYGGEEFVVVLPETDASSALAVAERIRKSISAHDFNIPNVGVLKSTVSMGVSCLPPAENKKDLVSLADQALYRAKESGRNRVAS